MNVNLGRRSLSLLALLGAATLAACGGLEGDKPELDLADTDESRPRAARAVGRRGAGAADGREHLERELPVVRPRRGHADLQGREAGRRDDPGVQLRRQQRRGDPRLGRLDVRDRLLVLPRGRRADPERGHLALPDPRERRVGRHARLEPRLRLGADRHPRAGRPLGDLGAPAHLVEHRPQQRGERARGEDQGERPRGGLRRRRRRLQHGEPHRGGDLELLPGAHHLRARTRPIATATRTPTPRARSRTTGCS